jgi:putative isomerase
LLTYKLNEIPFSHPDSFLALSARMAEPAKEGPARLIYRTCSRRTTCAREMPFDPADFFEIALWRAGVEIPYTWTPQPHRLDLHPEGGGRVTFVFADGDTLLFATQGVDLHLLPCKSFATGYAPGEGQFCLVDWLGHGVHHMRSTVGGDLKVEALPSGENAAYDFNNRRWQVVFTGGGAIRFSRFERFWDSPLPVLKQVLHDREKEFARWLKHLPGVPDRYRAAAEQAWFLLWNCQVPVGGALTRRGIYMSKFWMNAIWAWDNCFNALAVAPADGELAWNQLLLFFDHQEPAGMVPDMIYDQDVLYSFTKPPIHAWTIRKLVDRLGLKKSLPYLEKLYKPVARLTDWWYNFRDFDADGMCQYHHGNDSGWDNATVFDQGYPTEGADLAAHLTLQTEGLAFIAGALGKKKAAARWQARSEKQLNDLLALGTRDGRFYSPLDGTSQGASSHSLLNYIPMVLGHRLPASIRRTLVTDLGPDGPFLTGFGLATEAPHSEQYKPDGYWRGPVWAPSTYLIFDGLVDASRFAPPGEEVTSLDLARLIAERFCDMCVRNPGFWENYDALTGKGLCCPGYSWTAAVFLLLAEWLGQEAAR